MEESKVFRLRLKQARLATGLSQKSLGIAIGLDESISSSRMNKYETGLSNPDPKTVSKIAERLNVSVAFLYAETAEFAKYILDYDGVTTDERAKLLRLLFEP